MIDDDDNDTVVSGGARVAAFKVVVAVPLVLSAPLTYQELPISHLKVVVSRAGRARGLQQLYTYVFARAAGKTRGER